MYVRECVSGSNKFKSPPSWAVLEFRFQRRWTVNANSRILVLFFLILPGTNSVTNSMEQIWEHISFPRNSPRFVDFKTLRNPPPFLGIHFNVVLLSTPLFNYSCHISYSSYSPCCYHPNSIWWEVPIMKLLIMCSFLQAFNSSVSSSNILLTTRYWNTLSLYSSLNMTDQISQPCQTTSKIVDRTFSCSHFS
jgi:hypothetical protein